VFSALSVPRWYNTSPLAAKEMDLDRSQSYPRGVGVEYLHRDPASPRRRRNLKSQI
jgi:hypothetical protein